MAFKIEPQELDAILNEVDNLDETELKQMAAKVLAEKEKRKAYQTGRDLTPEQRESRKASQLKQRAKKLARQKAILEAAEKAGLIVKDSNGKVVGLADDNASMN